MKLCECGCGRPAPIAKKTNRRVGHVKGEPTRFLVGHNTRKPLDQLEKSSVYRRVRQMVPARPCDECGAEHADRHHRDHDPLNNHPDNIAFLCRSCHIREHWTAADGLYRGKAAWGSKRAA